LSGVNLSDFRAIFLTGSEEQNSLFFGSDAERWFYFESKIKSSSIFNKPIRDYDPCTICLPANSEEELLKFFDPKLLVLI
jgi:hypothetical protein